METYTTGLLTDQDANNRPIQPLGVVSLAVDIGGRFEVIHFKVVERLAVLVIIGCAYCDKHVEAIKPRQHVVEIEDGTTVPIIWKSPTLPQGSIPLPDQQQYPQRNEEVRRESRPQVRFG